MSQATVPESERHDTGSNYLQLTLKRLKQEVPGIKWDDYLKAFLGDTVSDKEPIVVYTMPFLRRLGEIMISTDKRLDKHVNFHLQKRNI